MRRNEKESCPKLPGRGVRENRKHLYKLALFLFITFLYINCPLVVNAALTYDGATDSFKSAPGEEGYYAIVAQSSENNKQLILKPFDFKQLASDTAINLSSMKVLDKKDVYIYFVPG